MANSVKKTQVAPQQGVSPSQLKQDLEKKQLENSAREIEEKLGWEVDHATVGKPPTRSKPTPENEDTIQAKLIEQEGGNRLALLVLADGAGGCDGGKRASQSAVQEVTDFEGWKLPLPEGLDEEGEVLHIEGLMRQAIMEAQNKVVELGQTEFVNSPDNRKPVTSLSIGLTWRTKEGKTKLTFGNIGDSRVYIKQEGRKAKQLSSDDSFNYDAARKGKEFIPYPTWSPMRNPTKGVGYPYWQMESHNFGTVNLKTGSTVLLGCDGVNKSLGDADNGIEEQVLRDLTKIMEDSDGTNISQNIVNVAHPNSLKKGRNVDDISAISLYIPEIVELEPEEEEDQETEEITKEDILETDIELALGQKMENIKKEYDENPEKKEEFDEKTRIDVAIDLNDKGITNRSLQDTIQAEIKDQVDGISYLLFIKEKLDEAMRAFVPDSKGGFYKRPRDAREFTERESKEGAAFIEAIGIIEDQLKRHREAIDEVIRKHAQ